MKKKFFYCILMMVLFPMTGVCRQVTVHIATDQAYWYPFTYSQNGQAKGIHIDMVAQALSNLNYTVQFYPRPWKRCLQEAQDGKYDAVVSASYKPERARYLMYPDDAQTLKRSEWRITQVEYVVITNFDASYTFDGDIKTLPKPVRAPLGYSISDDLKSAGLSVNESPDIMDCVRQLVKSGRGCFITPPENAQEIQLDHEFKGKLMIHPTPLKTKSYFMAFALNNQKLSRDEILAIWNEIARIREDKEFMKAIFDKYNRPK